MPSRVQKCQVGRKISNCNNLNMNRTNTNTKAMSTLKTHFQPVSNSGDDH